MKQLSAGWALVRASHPLPAVAVSAVAAGLALGSDRPLGSAVLATAAVFAGQLSVGWLNDLVDAPRDALVGRTDKPLAAKEIRPAAVRAAFLASAVAAVALTLLSAPLAAAAHLAALASAWAYDLKLKSTAISVLPFAVSFGLLPAFLSNGDPFPPPWLIAAAATLGSAAHFVNVLPDLADDAATGVRGLPHRLGPLPSRLATAALVLAASLLLVFGPDGTASPLALATVPAAVVILIAGFLLDNRPRSRAAFRAVMLVALIDVALLLHIGISAA
ncbi:MULTISPECIES: UbiA family prenyltransferase [Glycomyces]|uniref:4-hydroxybenzoate polyprenyltransferase n=2 Tax=Glycomyces TaxID=58113 RepID=A0A9X3PQW0_9ACTN|nr:UbiA family prenyltransferase [Glycomyces lechevalierae]MDA1383813.1 UbiA family prenyltransferase [Glycomyces lechevalierae]MDR7341195.1 4-hydroxybenzoate polyprenyltransferase [Glycomyces lechevalierae]